MLRLVPLALLAAATVAAAPVRPETDAQRIHRLYGTPDARRGAEFALDGAKLRLTLRPGSGSRAETDLIDLCGARTAREVEGDFVAAVRAAFPIAFAPGAEPAIDSPAAAAGLHAADGAETVTAVRQLYLWNGRPVEGFGAARRTASAGTGSGQVGVVADPPGAAFVRLVRVGQQVTAAYSHDGATWHDVDQYEVGWPARVRVGVIAASGHAARFTATFDRYTVTQPKK